MSRTLPANPPPGREPGAPEAAPAARGLAALRAEIDSADDALHDVLMHRASIVERIAALGPGIKAPFRPGREALVIRRLLARHQGALPRRAIARIWRELFAATTAMQGKFVITVCETHDHPGLAQLAREHFGALSPIRIHRTPAQAIAEVSSGFATAAVLPLPVEEEPSRAAWWVALRNRDEPRIHVVAMLPFWAAARPDGAVADEAFVVAANAPDASGHDRTLIGIEAPAGMSRARLTAALATAGFAPRGILLRRESTGGPAPGLIDVEGFVVDDDPRLGVLARAVGSIAVLGAYAVPVASAS